MPTTVGASSLAILVIAVLAAVSWLVIWRWGLGSGAEPIVVLWRRWAALGHVQTTGVRTTRRSRIMSRMAGAPLDHMPLPIEDADAPMGGGRGDEPKLAIRHRIRRGLRRTREKLGKDLQETLQSQPDTKSFEEIEEALIAADVGVATATELSDILRELGDQIPADGLESALRGVMVSYLTGAERRLRLNTDGISVWIVVGVNGTGKTTSIAKLAARAQASGISVCLAAADTYRAAAMEQLGEWGRRLDIDVIAQSAGADPGAVVFDAIAHAKAKGINLVIADTAGRLHTRKPLMDELEKVTRVAEREASIQECLLVVDATTGQNGVTQAKVFKEAVGVTGVVLAKMDGSAKGGIAFAVERDLEVPVKAVGVGEGYRDLVPFDPPTFVDAILGG